MVSDVQGMGRRERAREIRRKSGRGMNAQQDIFNRAATDERSGGRDADRQCADRQTDRQTGTRAHRARHLVVAAGDSEVPGRVVGVVERERVRIELA